MADCETPSEPPLSPRSYPSQMSHTPFLRKKPDYQTFKRIMDLKQRRTKNSDDFKGFFSPRKNFNTLTEGSFDYAELQRSTVLPSNSRQENDPKSSNIESRVPLVKTHASRPSARIFNDESPRESAKLSNKENSKQHATSKESTQNEPNKISLQVENKLLRFKAHRLQQENKVLHCQLKDKNNEITNLREQCSVALELTKRNKQLEADLKEKQAIIICLTQKITQSQKEIQELDSDNWRQSLTSIHSCSNIQQINSHHLLTIKRLTETNKNLEIQLYVLKNREHQFAVNSVRLSQMDSLTAKNRELKISNMQLRDQMDRARKDSVLEYSPEPWDLER